LKLSIADNAKTGSGASPINLHESSKATLPLQSSTGISTRQLPTLSPYAPGTPFSAGTEVGTSNEQFLRALLAVKSWILIVSIQRTIHQETMSENIQRPHDSLDKLPLSERKMWNVIWPLLREKLFMPLNDSLKFDNAAWSNFLDLIIFLFETESELAFLYAAEFSMAIDSYHMMVLKCNFVKTDLLDCQKSTTNAKIPNCEELFQGPTYSSETRGVEITASYGSSRRYLEWCHVLNFYNFK
jgi:hypothetical protein